MFNLFNKKSDFDKAFDFTMKWEGGYVNDPNDPGGETKYGISKRSYPDIDIKNLTKDRAKILYRQDYWEALNCHKTPWPINIVLFDFGVNLGVSRAKKYYKTTPIADTVSAFALNLIKVREDYYNRLAERRVKFKKYLKGWLNRTQALRVYILK